MISKERPERTISYLFQITGARYFSAKIPGFREWHMKETWIMLLFWLVPGCLRGHVPQTTITNTNPRPQTKTRAVLLFFLRLPDTVYICSLSTFHKLCFHLLLAVVWLLSCMKPRTLLLVPQDPVLVLGPGLPTSVRNITGYFRRCIF